MSKSEKQRDGLCDFLFHESEFCTICKQWLHNEHETLRNRSAVSTEAYLSPRLTPALHLKLFLLWTKNRKTMNGICTLATMWLVIYVEFGIYFWKRVVYFLVAACFIISCLLLSTFSYARIYQIVKRHQRQIQVQNQVFQGPNIGSNLNITRLKRSTINIFIFYMFLILCYSPIFPLIIVDVLLRNQVWSGSLMYATTVIFMNSAINPILYCCVLKDLRRAVLRAARKVFCK